MNNEECSNYFLGRRTTPKVFLNVKWAVVLLCIGVVGQSMMVSGAFTVSLTMIEKSFKYNSLQSGSVDTVYNVAFAISAFVLSYIGKKRKTYWLGLGSLIMSIGCITFIIPLFIPGLTRSILPPESLLCRTNSASSPLTCEKPSLIGLTVMCFAYVLIGIGSSPLHTLAINYIDEHSTQQESSLYTGIYYAFAAVGPAVTFLLSKFLLNIPIKLELPPGSFITSNSENWLGAYWIIYILGSLILLFVAIPLLLFPYSLPRKQEKEKPKKEPSTSSTVSSLSPDINLRNIFLYIKTLLKNYPYVLVNFGLVSEGVMSNAVGTFLPKYMEAQFGISPGTASLYTGILVVVGTTFGLFSGGFIMKKFAWPIRPLLLRITIASFLGTISLFFLLIRCPNSPIMGVVAENSRFTRFSSSCSDSCSCDTTYYYPICTNQNTTYYSPCVAGCKSQSGNIGAFHFSSCDCLAYSNVTSLVHTATQGGCMVHCNTLPLFMVLGLVAMILSFIIFIPILQFTIRVVGDELSLFALGFQQIKIRFAFIVGPLIFGHIIDYSCNLFQPVGSCNSQTSNCLRYDLNTFSNLMALASIACKALATLCHLGAYLILVRKPLNSAPTPPHSDVTQQ